MNPLDSRQLGTGPRVSPIGLGTNNFGRPGSATVDREGTAAVIEAALDAGITLFDTADIYNHGVSETFIGEILAGSARRDQVVIATKFGHSAVVAPGAADWGPKGSADYIRRACEASLTRLRTDRIDLYQMHTPDPTTPILETLTALNELMRTGHVRAIGHSNFSAAQVTEAAQVAAEHDLIGFCSAQDEWSLLNRRIEATSLDAIETARLGVLPYFPLASGLLTGKYRADHTPDGSRLASRPERLTEMLGTAGWERLERYRQLCDQAGLTMTEVSIGWLLAHPVVSSVIAGATTPAQVHANVAAGGIELPGELVTQVSALFPVG